MTFTIITGPGRCGTSALTEFFINSNLYRVDYIDKNLSMKAGLESPDSILINSVIYTSNLIQSIKGGVIGRIIDLYNRADIVKTPLFFYTNSYAYWQKILQPYGGIQVILLTRNNLDDIFTSAKNIKSPDWDSYTPTLLQNQWNLNIQTLENNNIPFITMEYPKFSKDPNYLYNNLLQLDLGNWKFSLEDIENLMSKSFY